MNTFRNTLLCLVFAPVFLLQTNLASVLPVRLGDLDEDGKATVLDLVRLINHLTGSNGNPATTNLLLAPMLVPYADLNEDGRIDQMDVDLLSDAILGMTPLPNPYSAPDVSAPVPGTNGTSILISGVARPNRRISVTGGRFAAFANSDSNGFFSVNVNLRLNQLNNLFVTASTSNFVSGTPQPLRILQDGQPPNLYIDFPTNGQTLYTSNTVIAGRVGDVLSGFMGLEVFVQSSPFEDALPLLGERANVNVGIGNNGTFERNSVPLAPGTNVITVTAKDMFGNTDYEEITIYYSPLVGSPSLELVSGDLQSSNVHRRLAQPIVIRALQADGVTPLANKVVTFEVTRSDGRLLPVDASALADPIAFTNDITRTVHGVMQLQLVTDANGQARARWALGGDAGRGNNRVCVMSAGISNAVYFCASARPAVASQINIGTGNNQKAETGGFVGEPLRAWVNDSCNGNEGIPVTFTIIQGGGRLVPVSGAEAEGGPSVTVQSSRTGHAEVLLQLGLTAGQNLIEATYPGNPGLPATFVAYGVARDPSQPTRLTGLVFDNASQPIGGAACSVSVGGQMFFTTSDAQGQFHFDASTLLSGPAQLRVDGATATNLLGASIPINSFPSLEFSLILIPNADNSLSTPVLLPRLNRNNARLYYGTNDLTLTCEGMEGLRMLVKANSMRKPDGSLVSPSNPTIIALNQVHHDQVPMPIPDGAAPPFAWTLQPGGATFDPPIQIEYPNMSALTPGTIAYFLSFNHDTRRFEIISSGHVIHDGSCIVSDPGAGLSLAGWGCNCPPYAVSGNVQSPEVKITGPREIKSCPNQSLHFTAAGAPEGGTYSWSGGENPPTGSGPTFSTTFRTPGTKSVSVTYTCPSGAAAQDSVTVQIPKFDEIEVRYRTFIKCAVISSSLRCFGFRSETAENSPTFFPSAYYSGDNRDFGYSNGTSRTFMTAKISLDPENAGLIEIPQSGSNETHGYNSSMVVAPAASGNWCVDFCRFSLKPNAIPECSQTAMGGHDFLVSYVKDTGVLTFQYKLSAHNPCVGISAAIDATPTFEFRQRCENGTIAPAEFRITGNHDGFPWHEIYINKMPVYQHDPCFAEDTLCSLFPPSEKTYPAELSSWRPVPASQTSQFKAEAVLDPSPRLDDSWDLTINGQTVRAQANGTYAIANIAAPDQFGLGGPGSAPDFLSDDFLRLRGVSVLGGTTRYLSSERFQIRQGETYAIRELIFSDFPPRTPESLQSAADNTTLTASGQSTQVRVTARYSDGTFADVTPRSHYTTYRISNPQIAVIDGDGLLTAKAKGRVLVTAVNEGAASVTQVDISEAQLTTVRGFLRDLNGEPLQSVLVSIAGGAQSALTDVNGQFSILDVPSDFGAITVIAYPETTGTLLFARAIGLTPVPGGFTEAGIIIVQALKPPQASFEGGGGHSVALKADGTVRAWGYNLFGQLGDNTTTPKSSPIQIGTGAGWAKVTAGFIHTLAIKTNGTLWAWGDNVFGQLGDGTEIDRKSPIQVGSSADWADVAAGEYHSLGLKRDGSLWAWGANFSGQLGDGSGADQSAPVRIGIDNDWVSVACGDRHSLAIKHDGSLWAWGSNEHGQLGEGSGADQFEPVPLDIDPNWIAITAGESHSLGLMADGSLWAWGDNTYGQLGDESFSDQYQPSPVGQTFEWLAVAAGLHHTLGLKADGSVWAWGRNTSGQLGDGSDRQQDAPIQLGTGHDWTAIAAGDHHSMASKKNGTLWTWGRNSSGQLGVGSTVNKTAPVQVLSDDAWKQSE